ncbi:copper resistance protein CopC [Nonomuraea sp. NN258]|uniref:copper resistance CopC family protein n=1 Tax=Nonomuraea antri TaxID=2730852 RepID=UPI001568AE35|nr:copper resistance CopC family protein [Nonomuraea antri]NRQ38968.1 copper resistance protein CopC [Nonomuraea antri]
MKRSPLAALTAILAALLVLGTAGPALAHDALKSSDPAKGAKVKTLDEIKLTFTAEVRMPFVIVRGPGDARHESGKPKADGAVVRQELKGALPDGKYTIAYRVVSSDGHPIEGEIPFTVEGAPAPAATESAAPAATESSAPAVTESAAPAPTESAAAPAPAAEQASAEQTTSFPIWLLIVVGALVGIGIGFLLSMRKNKR